ncbi:MAG: uracil-DNA glycosylase [Blastocatellia bacterium]|nr:uracil-DNA glycosylase [Blastocatellia bacterium]
MTDLALSASKLAELHAEIIACRRCPRLVWWREEVARRKPKRYREWEYWARPVPGFGDPAARLLIVGLAPAAHGANRTGRMFTGDRSGDWLYRALHRFGFADRPESRWRDDGLQLRDCYITAALRCAPPQNTPRPEELQNCRPFLEREWVLLRNIRVIIALGQIAYATLLKVFRTTHAPEAKAPRSFPRFRHGLELVLTPMMTLLASFHPSQQNTFTGKLTEPMFEAIFRRARELVEARGIHFPPGWHEEGYTP